MESDKKSYVIHPFLLAIYPIIFLYAHNIQEASIEDTYWPLVIAIISSIIFYLIFRLITKDKLKAGIITTIFIIIFYTYGHLFDWLVSLNLFWVKHRHILPITLFIFGYTAYFINLIKNEKILKITTKILNIITITLIIINIVTIIPAKIEEYKIQKNKTENLSKNDTNSTIKKSISTPDIYYIVLDEYAGFETIKNIWGYDNSDFKSFLEKTGFILADKTYNRYDTTFYSLASSLNMEYIDKKEPLSKVLESLKDNEVTKFLKKKGYKIITFTEYDKRVEVKTYDISYKDIKIESDTPPFSQIILECSILHPFLNTLTIEADNLLRATTKYKLQKIKESITIDGPKFTYLHILCPHPPYVFKKNGEKNDASERLNAENKNNYLNQYIFITKEIEEIVDMIVKKSKNTPIIVLQSDHGPRNWYYAKGKSQIISYIPKTEYTKILNAYYLPNFNKKSLANNISPSNTFRLIFNQYFNANFTLLKN